MPKDNSPKSSEGPFPTILILLGPPGAGKGTQCKALAEALRIPHISTGDILRDNDRRDTELGRDVRKIMKNGNLVPDILMLNMLAARIAGVDCAGGFILDGFPRTQDQAESLDLHLSKQVGLEQRSQPFVIRLVVGGRSLLNRIAGRQICPACRTIYGTYLCRPCVSGKCDVDGAGLVVREDDREETILERLRIYEQQILPIVEHYSKHGSVREIDGDRVADDVTAEILRAMSEAGRAVLPNA